ncbi:hypothetical protein BGZ94_002684, partial [Podila epigama]
LSSESLTTIAEHCPSVERLDLTGCRQLSSKALSDVCMNMSSLNHLDLASLSSVNDSTLHAMGVYCRSLQVLNLAWCRNISGAGLVQLTKSCQELLKLNVSGCPGLEDRWLPTIGMNLPRLRELCMNGCHSLTDRGVIGLLTGLAMSSTKQFRRTRKVKRLSSSLIRLKAALGEGYNSSCLDKENDDDSHSGDEDEDSDDEEDQEEEEEEEEEVEDDDQVNNNTIQGSPSSAPGGGTLSNMTGLLPTSSNSSSSPHSRQEGLQTRLRYLGLSRCRQLTQEALRAVGFHCNRHLRRLEIAGCENFGDEGLIYLAQHCVRLRLLDVEDDNRLTDASLRAFGMFLPRLERICLSYCENITDQGVLRMLRPPTLHPNTPINMTVNPDKCCIRLRHLELDNCLLITDRLLLEFANVLEDRRIKALAKQRAREQRQEERRERIRQKRKKVAYGSGVQDGIEPPEDDEGMDGKQRPFRQQQQHGGSSSSSKYHEGSLRSLVEIVQNSMPSSVPRQRISNEYYVSTSSSAPVNIPTTVHRRYHMSIAEMGGAAASSSSISSSSPSPLQPRGVTASTSVSEEMAIKKAGQKPILRIITPTRTASSSSLPLWPSSASLSSSSSALYYHGRHRAAAQARPRVKKSVPPVIQVFDCRNITLEGVEAAQKKCEALVVKSYYSWTNPRPMTATTSTVLHRPPYGYASGASYGVMDFGEEYDEEDEDGHGLSGEDDDESGEGPLANTTLQHLQLQHQQHQQNRNLFHRARLGLLGRAQRGRHDNQCHIL